MLNIQYIINNLRNTIDAMDYIQTSDYDKLTSNIDALERELQYKDEYEEYANELRLTNELDEIDERDEDLYN